MELFDSLILVVDDLKQNLQVIGNLLENQGYDTTFAVSGKQALEQIKISPPDLILLDLMMPEMSGLEVCKILKSDERWQNIPVIFLTANRDPQSLVEAFNTGAADYITKPFQPEEVLARINSQLTQIALRRQLQQQNQELQAEIAQRHQTEQALVQAKQAAETANQAKSTFLANMSHELRSPLNAILGFTQLLRRGTNLTSVQQENVNIVYRSGRHLLDLINDILDLSKIEAGRVQLHWETIDLLELLSEIRNMLSLRASDKGLILHFEIDRDVPRCFVSDRLRLRQILINLIGNAIKFTEKGSINLAVNWVKNQNKSSQASNCLGFVVEDTGVGIAPHELSLLFQPFSQTTSGFRAAEGTGLGLAISRRYIYLLGGEIQVASELGQGTTFQFELPIQEARNQAPEPQNAFCDAGIAIRGLAPTQPQYRILVVDDRVLNRQLLKQILSPLGFQVKTAPNGAEAIAQWQSFRPHLIWMDLKMPGIDGYEVTRQIRQQEAQYLALEEKPNPTKIIALTASVLADQEPLARAAGCDDFMSKPFVDTEILAKIKQHLQVEYLYDRVDRHNSPSPEGLSLTSDSFSEALATLSPDWLQHFQQAILSLDTEIILALINDLPPEQAELAANLREQIENFNYDPLLQAIAQISPLVKIDG